MNTKWVLGVVVWAIASFLSASALGADWSFAVLGDTRGERSSTTNGLFGFSLATVKADEMTIEYYSLNTSDTTWTKDSYVTHILPNQTVPEASSAVLLAPAMMTLMAGRFRKRRRN